MNKTFDTIKLKQVSDRNADIFPIKNVVVSKAFKYKKTLGRYISNYKNYDLNSLNSECICSGYNSYIPHEHKHIVTGNMDIVKEIVDLVIS